MSEHPAFALGSGGCSCASCKETRRFADSGFAKWPRGNPAGIARSKADYAAHVAAGKSGGVDRAIPAFKIQPEPYFSSWGLAAPMPAPSAVVRNWIASSYAWADGRNVFQGPNVQKSKGPNVSALARPLKGSSPAAHFPERDRPLETAVIYAMPKSQPKRPVGRPPIGKRRLIVLDEEAAEQARMLGGGNLSAGIRYALSVARAHRRARS